MRKMIDKKFLALFLKLSIVLLAAGFCMGCKGSSYIGKGDYEYSVYFRQLNTMDLAAVSYKTNTKSYETETLIEELWGVFSAPPAIESKITTVTDAVVLEKYALDKKTLTFYFDGLYHTMDSMTEVVFRAALVKTFSLLDGVNNIAICVDEQPLTDSAGNSVGKMVSYDFVGIGSGDVNTVENDILSLYFANREGDALVRQEVEVLYSPSFSVERFVVECLIEGPQEDGYYATLPSDVKLIGITVKDYVCYVNFDSTFIDNPLSVKPYVTVYSIVNSLMDLPNIRKVQILINGSSDVKFRDSISFSEALEMNLDYVEKTKK